MNAIARFFVVAGSLACALSALADGWRIVVTEESGSRAEYSVMSATFMKVRKGAPPSPVTLTLSDSPKARAAFKNGHAFRSALIERITMMKGKPQVLASATYEAPTVTKSNLQSIGGKKTVVVTLTPTSIKPS
jgi:hypothetical protein